MSKETIWLIFAGLTALLSVPLMYVGLQSGRESFTYLGFGLFTLGMMVTPVMRLMNSAK